MPSKYLYFNPRSREGSDPTPTALLSLGFQISIHAPAKGATGSYPVELTIELISIHAPAKGAT